MLLKTGVTLGPPLRFRVGGGGSYIGIERGRVEVPLFMGTPKKGCPVSRLLQCLKHMKEVLLDSSLDCDPVAVDYVILEPVLRQFQSFNVSLMPRPQKPKPQTLGW